MKMTSNEDMEVFSVNQHQWILDHAAQRSKELGADRAVHSAVIAAHGDAQALLDDELSVADDHLVFGGADREDRGFGRGDDFREPIGAEHPQVPNPKGQTPILTPLDLPP